MLVVKKLQTKEEFDFLSNLNCKPFNQYSLKHMHKVLWIHWCWLLKVCKIKNPIEKQILQPLMPNSERQWGEKLLLEVNCQQSYFLFVHYTVKLILVQCFTRMFWIIIQNSVQHVPLKVSETRYATPSSQSC